MFMVFLALHIHGLLGSTRSWLLVSVCLCRGQRGSRFFSNRHSLANMSANSSSVGSPWNTIPLGEIGQQEVGQPHLDQQQQEVGQPQLGQQQQEVGQPQPGQQLGQHLGQDLGQLSQPLACVRNLNESAEQSSANTMASWSTVPLPTVDIPP